MVADDPENEDQKHKRILDIGDMIGVDMFEGDEEGEEDAPGDDE
jgi:hypothetical protein